MWKRRTKRNADKHLETADCLFLTAKLKYTCRQKISFYKSNQIILACLLPYIWTVTQREESVRGWTLAGHQAAVLLPPPVCCCSLCSALSCLNAQQQMTWPSLVFYKRLFSCQEREQAALAVPARRLHYRYIVNYSRQRTRRGTGGVRVRRGGKMGEEGVKE